MSKKACFLCHSFIRAHGSYRVLKTHGEVFVQWIIPDAFRYEEQMRKPFARALSATYTDTLNALKAARNSKVRFAPQVQSAVNSAIPSLSTISASTIRADRPKPDIMPPLTVSDARAISSGIELPVKHEHQPLYDPSSSSISLIGTITEDVNTHQCCLEAGSQTIISKDWLNLHVEVEELNVADPNCELKQRGHCQVMTASDHSGTLSAVRIDAKQLVDGDSVALERGGDSPALDVVFTAPGADHMRLEVSWVEGFT